MNTPNVVSINPVCTPAGINIAKDILSGKRVAVRPKNAVRDTARILLGVTTCESDSRRQWTFRMLLGSILMCFGLLFMDSTAISGPEYVVPGIAMLMIAGGALIACGLLTRLISLALGIILVTFMLQISLATMTGYAMMVCTAACIAGIITGSGRYSLDTLIYNRIVRDFSFSTTSNGVA